MKKSVYTEVSVLQAPFITTKRIPLTVVSPENEILERLISKNLINLSPPHDLKVVNPPAAHTNTQTQKVIFKVIFKFKILASLCHITKEEILYAEALMSLKIHDPQHLVSHKKMHSLTESLSN